MNNFSPDSLAIAFDVSGGRIDPATVCAMNAKVQRVVCGVYLVTCERPIDSALLERLILNFGTYVGAVDVGIRSNIVVLSFYESDAYCAQSGFVWQSFGEIVAGTELAFCRVAAESLLQMGVVFLDPGHVSLYFGPSPGALS